MKSLDLLQKERNEIMQRMAQAVRGEDAEGFAQAWNDLAGSIQEGILGDVRELRAQQDNAVLAARGCRVLTSQEKQYYEKVIDAMRTELPKQALTGIDTVLPETVIDAVFEDIKTSHPLLSAIRFQNTGALVKIILSTTGGAAKWGAIDHTITSELTADFLELDLSLAKLTAFMPVNRYMLDLGPAWLDRYVRELLTEALAVQLEVGIVDGTGKDMPVGMDRKLTGAVDGVYALKDAVSVTDLSPQTYGSLLDTLTQGPNGVRRTVASVVLVVNPSDYFTKVFPATCVRSTEGTFNHDVFPFPTTVIQSAAVPAGKAIMGIPSKYFMGVGTQSGGRIEYSDEYKFLEQVRTYAIFLYGYGRAMDENAFVYLDISGLKPHVLTVKTVAESAGN